MRLHVVLSERGGADWFPPIVLGNDGHRDSIGIHPGPDMVEPAVDGTARVVMSPLAEVPLRHDRRKVRAFGKRLDPRATADGAYRATPKAAVFQRGSSEASSRSRTRRRSWPAAVSAQNQRAISSPPAAGFIAMWPSK